MYIYELELAIEKENDDLVEEIFELAEKKIAEHGMKGDMDYLKKCLVLRLDGFDEEKRTEIFEKIEEVMKEYN